MRPLIRLLFSVQVTDEIPSPITRTVNRPLPHPAGAPVSFALAGTDR
jgi:hypothetical protein